MPDVPTNRKILYTALSNRIGKESHIKTEKHHLIPGNFPFSPRKVPFYYGWIALLAGILGMYFSIPGQTMGVSVYTDHLISALGLSRINISTTYMFGTLASALVMTRAGIFYDRFGARVAAAGSAVGLSVCLFALSWSVEITGFLSGLLGLPKSGTAFGFMIVGFFGIRFFGQGVMTLVSRGMVMRWFEEHRGFAAAILGIFISFGFSYAPRLLQGLINLRGWDGSWRAMAFAMVLGVLPFIVLVFRDSPEDCGMEMEENINLKHREKKIASEPPRSYTLQEARKDPRLWCYMFALFFYSFYITAFTFHVTSIFASQGQDVTQAVGIFLPISIISVIFGFSGSWLSDFIDLKYHFYVFVIAMGAGALALTMPYEGIAVFLLIGGFGIGGGLFTVLTGVTWPKLFGREHLGAISGMAMSFMVAGSSLGPLSFSLMEKMWGHYRHTGWLGVLCAALLGLGSLPFLPKSKPHPLQSEN